MIRRFPRRAQIPSVLLKKTEYEQECEDKRGLKRKKIREIRHLLDDKHYSERAAALTLGVSRNTVRRVREGDIELLCQSSSKGHSRLDRYASPISEWLTQGKQFIEIRVLLQQIYGVTMGNSQVSIYCAEIKKSLGLCLQRPKIGRFTSRQAVFKHIWSDQSLDEQDWKDVCLKYPALPQLDVIIHEFRKALNDHDADQLICWMEHYGNSRFSHINSFINGLKHDWKAVKNGFTYTVEFPIIYETTLSLLGLNIWPYILELILLYLGLRLITDWHCFL